MDQSDCPRDLERRSNREEKRREEKRREEKRREEKRFDASTHSLLAMSRIGSHVTVEERDDQIG